MTNELPPGTFIEEFVSGGPKNYAFRLNNGRNVVKIKGFCLDRTTSLQLNMTTMKMLVYKFVKEHVIEIIPVFMYKIERTKWHEVVSKFTKKDYRVVYDKRKVCDDFCTLPYGY